MWKFLVSHTDDKWQLRQFFDSCNYFSWPTYVPDDRWWRHFDDTEDHLWRPFDDPND
jgi:hypothetical protein